MATKVKATTITTMVSRDTILRVIQLDLVSYSIEDAARILDIDRTTLMAKKPKLEEIKGFKRRRITKHELLRLMAEAGMVPDDGFEPADLDALPPKTRRKILEFRGEAGLNI